MEGNSKFRGKDAKSIEAKPLWTVANLEAWEHTGNTLHLNSGFQ